MLFCSGAGAKTCPWWRTSPVIAPRYCAVISRSQPAPAHSFRSPAGRHWSTSSRSSTSIQCFVSPQLSEAWRCHGAPPTTTYPNLLKESRMTVTNWTAALLPDLTGKTFIVTGATTGLGKATADAVARAGAHAVLAGRNHAKGQAVAEANAGGTRVRQLNLSSLSSVGAYASSWQGPIDVLI